MKGPEPVGRRNPGVIYGLGNLVENAVDFAAERTEIAVRWSEQDLAVTISDDGPGFPPEILRRIGEPYVTSRRRTGTEGESYAERRAYSALPSAATCRSL